MLFTETDLAVALFSGKKKLLEITDDREKNKFQVQSFKSTDDVLVLNKSNFSDMSYLFRKFQGRSLDLRYFDTSGVYILAAMFRSCPNLVEVKFGNFDTSNVTDMCGMFRGCVRLSEVDLSGFNTSRVRDMSNMFEGCERLVQVDLGNFSLEYVSDLRSMFCNCYRLERVVLGKEDGVVLSRLSKRCLIGMFGCCFNLKGYKVPKDLAEIMFSSGDKLYEPTVAYV